MNHNTDLEPKSDIWVLIPAYNEETSIAAVVSDLRQHGYHHMLVVDDGSKDATASEAERLGVEVLRHIINRGQGAALRTGINYLKEAYRPRIIVTFDADGQHQAKDIAHLIRPILADEADIVLGSRFLSRGNSIPFLRKLVLKAGIAFTYLMSRMPLTDTHNGLRAMNRKASASIVITHRGMEHASDIIDEIRRNRLRYCERPVHIIYSEYSLHKGQHTLSFMKMGIKLILKKLM